MSKIRISFKTPDATYHALQNIDDEDERCEARIVFSKFIEYDEYVTVEFNTETGEAIVVER